MPDLYEFSNHYSKPGTLVPGDNCRRILGLPERLFYRIGVFFFYIGLFFAISFFSKKVKMPDNQPVEQIRSNVNE